MHDDSGLERCEIMSASIPGLNSFNTKKMNKGFINKDLD